MKKLSNTEAELKKSVAYKKKACNSFEIHHRGTQSIAIELFKVKKKQSFELLVKCVKSCEIFNIEI